MKHTDEARNEQIEQNEFISKEHKNVFANLIYIDHFFILSSTVTGCFSISNFAFLVDIPVGVTSSAAGSIICLIAARIKKYKSIIKKKKKKYEKIVLLAKGKLNNIEV